MMLTRLLVLLLVWLPVTAFGATRYVDKDITDCATYTPATGLCGAGSANAYASVLTALAALQPGDRLEIRGGDYPTSTTSYSEYGVNSSQDYGGGSTSWDTATVITNYPGETVTINTSGFNMDSSSSLLGTTGSRYIIWEGESRERFILSGRSVENSYAFRVNNSTNHIRVKKLTIKLFMNTGAIAGGTSTGSGSTQCTNKPADIEIVDNLFEDNGNSTSSQEHSIYPACSQNWVVEKNHIIDSYVYGIHFNNSGTGVTLAHVTPVIRYNKIEGRRAPSGSPQSGCIFINRSSSPVIYQNLCDGLGVGTVKQTVGIQVGSNVTGALILSNTIHDLTGACIQYSGTSNTGSVVKNNICDDASDTFQLSAGTAPTTIDANLCPTDDTHFGAGACDQVTATPGFVSAGTDFSLAAGAAALNNGAAHTGYNFNGTKPEIGAFEVPIHSTCSVEDGDASNLRITFENNVHPPLLPATGITGFTARKAGSNDVIVGGVCARVGDNRVDCPLTDAIVNGNTVDYSYSQTGNLTDSALIGGSDNQEVHAITNQSCTNNVGAAATHVFIQAAYEWHGLRGTEAEPVMLRTAGGSSENLDIKPMPGGSARLRIAITCTTADCPATGFYPYVSHNGGAYAVVPDDFGSANIKFCGTSDVDADIPPSGGATTEQLSTSGTFVPGALVRTSNAIPTVDLDNDPAQKTELEYCVVWDTDAAADATYDFRIRKQDGSVIDTYTVTPRATIQASGAGGGF
jgi:hypothetical protein